LSEDLKNVFTVKTDSGSFYMRQLVLTLKHLVWIAMEQ